MPLIPIVGSLLPQYHIELPWLEITQAFAGEASEYAQLDAANTATLAATEMSIEKEDNSLPFKIVSIWAIGALLTLIVRAWKALSLRLECANSTPTTKEDTLVILLKKITKQYKIRRTPWLLVNNTIESPITSGVLRPIIILPSHVTKLEKQEQTMILKHELAHVKRFDVLLDAFIELVCVLFWFLPLTWIVTRRHHLEKEKACDDAVLESGHPAHDYSELLLSYAKSTNLHSKSTSQRIRSILHRDKSRKAIPRILYLSWLSCFALISLSVSLFKLSPHPKVPKFTPFEGDHQLAALWKMNLQRGSFIPDWSGNGNHGKIVGATWVNDPERGACLSFDGVNDFLAMKAPAVDWSTQPFTLCVWLKPSKDANGGGLLTKGDRNGIWSTAVGNTQHSTKGVFAFSEREISLANLLTNSSTYREHSPGLHPTLNYHNFTFHQCETPIVKDKWNHLAIVTQLKKNKLQTKIYINGKPQSVLDSLKLDRNDNLDWPTPLWYFGHGESPLSKDNHFDGLASDLAIYQKALTQEQVKAVMNRHFIQ